MGVRLFMISGTVPAGRAPLMEERTIFGAAAILRTGKTAVKLLQGKSNRLTIQALEQIQKGLQRLSMIFFVRTQYTGKAFRTVKGDPRKLAAMVIEKTGS